MTTNISKRCIIITSTLPILTFFPKDLQRDRRRWYQNYHRRIKYRRTISTLSQPIQHRCPKSPLQIRSSSSMLSRKRHTFSPSRRSHSRRNWFRRHSWNYWSWWRSCHSSTTINTWRWWLQPDHSRKKNTYINDRITNHLDDLERAIDVLLQLIVQRPFSMYR